MNYDKYLDMKAQESQEDEPEQTEEELQAQADDFRYDCRIDDELRGER